MMNLRPKLVRSSPSLLFLVISTLFTLLNNHCYAQELDFQQVVSTTSPVAASLGKYIDYPVALNNGLPGISIPLYELQSSRLSVPVSLSYHAGGTKVTERTSSMGLGWTLNAGGAIVRVVHGLPDDSQYGFLNMVYPNGTRPNDRYKEYCLTNYIYNHYTPEDLRDGEPDTYFYNFQNGNGKFMFRNKSYLNEEPTAAAIPYAPIQIKYKQGNAALNAPFTIVDKDGITYEFGKDYRSSITPPMRSQSSATDNYSMLDGPVNVREVTTAWYLTSIVSADKSDTIFFKYNDVHDVSLYQRIMTSMYVQGLSAAPGIYPQMYASSLNRTEYSARLTKIVSKRGRLIFNYNGEVLQSIDVLNGEDQKIKSFTFFTSQFTSSIANAPNRLRLDSLSETGFSGATIANAPYKFVYNTNDVPPYNTNAQDIWGYYNGYSPELGIGTFDNNNLLMYNKVKDPLAPAGKDIIAKLVPEKRAVNPDLMSKAMLQKIIYPTGGFTSFNFEPNQTMAMVPVLIPGRSLEAAYVSTMNMYAGSETKGIDVTFKPSANGSGVGIFSFSGSRSCTGGTNNCIYQQPRAELTDLTTGATVMYRILDGLESGALNSESFNQQVNVDITHTYRLRLTNANTMTSSNQTPMYRMSATYYDMEADRYENQLKNVFTGGHRVTKITNDDGLGSTTVKEYNYTKSYFNSNAFNGTFDFIVHNTTQRKKKDGNNATSMLTVYYSEFPSVPIGGSSNSSLSYEEVEEIIKDVKGNKLGKSVFTFNKALDDIPARLPYVRLDREYARKQLLNTKIYSTDGKDGFTLLKEIQNTYNNFNDASFEGAGRDSIKFYVVTSGFDFRLRIEDGGTVTSNSAGGIKSMGCQLFEAILPYYSIDPLYYHIYRSTLTSTKVMDYSSNSQTPLISETNYAYDNPFHLLPTKISSVGSVMETKEQFFKYVADMKYESCTSNSCQTTFNQQAALILQTREQCEQTALNAMNYNGYDQCQVDYQNAISVKMAELATCQANQQQAYTNCKNNLPENDKAILTMQERNMLTAPVEINNAVDGKNIEKKVLTYKVVSDAKGSVFPAEIFKEIGNSLRESYVKFNQYDLSGNIVERARTNDANEVYIWGYDNQYPVAKIVGSTYNTAISYLNQAILQKPASDQQLRDELNQLRIKLPVGKALVTTYTYAPLIGVTSETDPSGRTTFYEYDGLGRLKLVKDITGKILKQFDYQYQKPITQ